MKFRHTLLVTFALATTACAPATPEATPTRSPTLTPTPDPAFTLVEHNADWRPIVEDIGGFPMALVPAGCFEMGTVFGRAGDERPPHEQCLQPFWLDLTEVTNTQYGSSGRWSGDAMPRDSVNWFDASEFCQSRGGRLPTEAEWEYAARGPDGWNYPWGDDFEPDYTIYHENSGGQTAPAGSLPEGASWVGALDMAGNLFEWTSSLYDRYPFDALDGRESQSGQDQRVLRGGSWYFEPRRDNVLAHYRVRDSPYRSDAAVGFRCVVDY